ncbi:MAG: malate dehydrogenase, partial [Candidatus Omnitrophica bacterium]|nr:malate dehydrogenase [Candidatus Omnitrophota bacterium]
AQKINQKCINPIIIVVTNPLDVMSHLLFKTGRFQANQVIGMGGVSDCARFNMLVASELETTSCNIQSTIIGAHGDSMLVLPRLCTVSGIPVTDLLAQDKINYIIEQTCNFGAKIVELLGQGSAYYGPAAGIFQLVDAIINDRKKILCASTYLEGQYGLENIFLGIPVKIGRFGIEEIIELDLTAEEKKKLLYSANKVQESIKKLGV